MGLPVAGKWCPLPLGFCLGASVFSYMRQSIRLVTNKHIRGLG